MEHSNLFNSLSNLDFSSRVLLWTLSLLLRILTKKSIISFSRPSVENPKKYHRNWYCSHQKKINMRASGNEGFHFFFFFSRFLELKLHKHPTLSHLKPKNANPHQSKHQNKERKKKKKKRKKLHPAPSDPPFCSWKNKWLRHLHFAYFKPKRKKKQKRKKFPFLFFGYNP